VIRLAAALVVAVAVLAGCGGGDDDAAVRPVVDQIAPAVAAVEAELDGPQQYFEINATPQVVNLFVAGADGVAVTPYVYVGGELAPAGLPSTAEGNTFAASALTFDPDTIFDHVDEDLPDPDIVLFSVIGGPGGAVQYGAGVQSAEGGMLDIVLAPDGTVQSVAAGS
jgi:hypothetical protein